MLLVGLATLWSMRDAIASEGWVRHTLEVQLRSADLLSSLQDLDTHQGGYLLTGNPAYLDTLGAAKREAVVDLGALRALTNDNPRQLARLDTLATLIESKVAEMDSTIAVSHSGAAPRSPLLTRHIDHGSAVMQQLRATMQAVDDEEARLLIERSGAATRERQMVVFVVIAGTALSVFLAVLVNGLLARYANAQTRANGLLTEQRHELEMQNAQLHEQAVELETQQAELEASNEELLDTQDEERRARSEAEAANRAKSEFLTTMSHELRTPLNATIGYAELLETGVRGPVTAEQAEDLRRIKRAGTHLLALINDVLNYAKLEAAQIQFAMAPLPILDVLAESAGMIEPQARSKGVAFAFVGCDPAFRALGDRDKILQVIVNLLSNAVKFTRAGGEVVLRCDSPDGDGMLSVVVQDTGRGIPADHLEQVFEPFVQVGRVVGGSDAGVGLGLAISRELARGMGGELTVASTVGEGSRFTFHLPRAR